MGLGLKNVLGEVRHALYRKIRTLGGKRPDYTHQVTEADLAGDDLDALMGSYRRLAGTVTGDVSGAVADLNTQFGATGPALEAIVTHTLKAKAAFGEFDITSLGQAMKSFGVDAQGTGAFLDHAGTVAQATGHSMQALIGDMRMYGPIAKNAGLSSEETATFIGKMAEAGVSVSRVMPGLSSRACVPCVKPGTA